MSPLFLVIFVSGKDGWGALSSTWRSPASPGCPQRGGFPGSKRRCASQQQPLEVALLWGTRNNDAPRGLPIFARSSHQTRRRVWLRWERKGGARVAFQKGGAAEGSGRGALCPRPEWYRLLEMLGSVPCTQKRGLRQIRVCGGSRRL